MNYVDILKRAAKITWRAKYLWIFGLLAGAGAGGFNFGSSNWQGNSSSGLDGKQAMSEIQDFMSDYLIWIMIGVVILLIIGLIFFVLSVVARGALIHCVDYLDAKKPTGFKNGLRVGLKKFWPVLATSLFFGLILMAALIILGVPVGLLFYFQMTVRAVLLLLFALAIYLPLAIALSFIAIWSWQYIVIENKKAMESWKLGLNLFRHNVGSNLLMWLLIMLVGVVAGIVFMFVVLIVAIPFVILGVMAHVGLQWAGVAAVVAAGVVFLFILSLLYGAILSTFQSATWTLMFRELTTKDTK